MSAQLPHPLAGKLEQLHPDCHLVTLDMVKAQDELSVFVFTMGRVATVVEGRLSCLADHITFTDVEGGTWQFEGAGGEQTYLGPPSAIGLERCNCPPEEGGRLWIPNYFVTTRFVISGSLGMRVHNAFIAIIRQQPELFCRYGLRTLYHDFRRSQS